MTISIVIATYNAGRVLRDCLRSCVEQTWQDREIIVIDGGSTDDTLEIIRNYRNHIAYWSSEHDRGIFDAWNKALDHVTGSWVLFRGADDVFWDPTALERIAPHLMTAGPRELVCYGIVVSTDEAGCIRMIHGEPWSAAGARMRREMAVPHAAAFHHVELFRRFGRFDADYRVAGDYEFLLRAFVHPDVKAKFASGELITRYWVGGNSGRHVFLSRIEECRARRRHGVAIIPWLQYRRILTNIRSVVMRRMLYLLGDRIAGKVYSWRRRQVSIRLKARLPHAAE